MSVTNERLPNEVNDRIIANSIFFPISKAWHEDNPPWFDAVRSYESAVSKIPTMLATDPNSIVDRYIDFGNGFTIHFKLNVVNTHLYGPNDKEACQFFASNQRTPGLALANLETYSLVIVGDISYQYLLLQTDEFKPQKDETYREAIMRFTRSVSSSQYTKGVIENGYVTAIPLMIGSKWCATRNLPYSALIRSGEDFTNLNGHFIVGSPASGSFLRYLQPTMIKPINKALVQHNEHDKQVSRVEVQYSRGCEYEHSYYIVASCLKKEAISGNAVVSNTISVNDYGFSLQMNHSTMNTFEGTVTGSNKKLINFVPIKILFAAFGCTTDADMLDYICPDRDDSEGLVTSIKNAVLYGFSHAEAYNKAHIELVHTPYNYLKLKEPWTQALALYIIGSIILKPKDVLEKLLNASGGDQAKYRAAVADTTKGVLDETFMPAIGNHNGVDRNKAVCFTIGFIVRDLYLVGTNLKTQQFKNSLENKRIRWGQQITKEFKAYYTTRLRKDLIPAIISLANSVKSANFDKIIADKIKTTGILMGEGMVKGMISSFKGSGGENSKIRNSLAEAKNAYYMWNKIREVMKSPSLKQHGVNELWINRRPHPSESFYLDPIEGPDSDAIGKFRTLCIHTRVTVVDDETSVLQWLAKQPEFKYSIQPRESLSHYVIFVNGSVVGYVPHFAPVERFYRDLMQLRRTGEIPEEMSIVLNNVNSKLELWLEAGRIMRPFVIAENAFNIDKSKKLVTIKAEFKKWLDDCNSEIGHFHDGIKNGFVEYLCCDMLIQNCVIADSISRFYRDPMKFTHISIGSAIDGIIVAANPCATLNLPNRAQIATNHLKQAAGYPITKCPQLLYINNMDMLIGAQQPLIQSHVYRHMHLDQFPIGNQVIIAFINYEYNQEDAVILNRRSVENGLLEIDTIDTFRKMKTKSDEVFTIPPLNGNTSLRGDVASYSKLGSKSCLPSKISSTFNEGDALIARCRRTTTGLIDISTINDMPSASNTANARPRRCIERNYIHENDPDKKVLSTGEYRVFIPGDKLSTEQCQKGTVGRIIDEECLPYTEDGIVPDVIFSPTSIFKRKTFGMLYVSVMSYLASLYGCFIENSTYGTCRDPDEIIKIIDNAKLDRNLFTTMYDPETGRSFKAFVGVCYYERQHHLVETKLNIRCGGPRDPATNQPTKGKRKHGGTKFDRMSCDALTSSGASSISIDFHLNGCNKVDVGICNRCHGMECFHDLTNHQWKCPTCGYHSEIEIIQVPLASIQLNQLLTGVHFKLHVNETE